MNFFAIAVGPLMLFLPIVISVYILRLLDNAAKNRKAQFGKSKLNFFIVDFFSLLFLIQLPFSFLGSGVADRGIYIAIGILVLSMVSIWWTTITTVSQAGIKTVGWRALISMIAIPSAYIGSFYLVIEAVNLMRGELISDLETKPVAFLVISAIGILVSPLIVEAAIRNVKVDLEHVE